MTTPLHYSDNYYTSMAFEVSSNLKDHIVSFSLIIYTSIYSLVKYFTYTLRVAGRIVLRFYFFVLLYSRGVIKAKPGIKAYLPDITYIVRPK